MERAQVLGSILPEAMCAVLEGIDGHACHEDEQQGGGTAVMGVRSIAGIHGQGW
jgi:hypothetical protein